MILWHFTPTITTHLSSHRYHTQRTIEPLCQWASESSSHWAIVKLSSYLPIDLSSYWDILSHHVHTLVFEQFVSLMPLWQFTFRYYYTSFITSLSHPTSHWVIELWANRANRANRANPALSLHTNPTSHWVTEPLSPSPILFLFRTHTHPLTKSNQTKPNAPFVNAFSNQRVIDSMTH